MYSNIDVACMDAHVIVEIVGLLSTVKLLKVHSNHFVTVVHINLNQLR